MRFRRVDIFSRVSRWLDAVGAVAAGALAAGALAAGALTASALLSLCAMTSGLLTTPPRPVPVTSPISIPESVASRRAAGEDLGSAVLRGTWSAGSGRR